MVTQCNSYVRFFSAYNCSVFPSKKLYSGNNILISISKFCCIFLILYLHIFPIEIKIRMCKIYTAFQIFFRNAQLYIAEFYMD